MRLDLQLQQLELAAGVAVALAAPKRLLRVGPDLELAGDHGTDVLGGDRVDDARARIAEAIAAQPGNSAWQDAAAMVAAVAGDADAARDHSMRAARISPDDPYLLWQVHRAGAMIAPPKE